MKENQIIKGLFGVVAPVSGLTVSVLAQVEAWLRIGSLLVGISVGIVTLLSIIRGWRKYE